MPDDRGDVIRKALDAGFPLDGEFLFREQRALWAMLTTDPGQIGQTLPRLSLHDRVAFEALVIDATQAPFRKNGRACTVPFSIAGGAATVAFAFVANLSKAKLFVADKVLWGQTAAVSLRVIQRQVSVGNLAGIGVVDLESGPIGDPSISVAKPTRPFIADLNGGTGVVALASFAGSSITHFSNSPGSEMALGNVVWPNEELDLVCETVNVLLEGTLYGRLWDFGLSQPTT